VEHLHCASLNHHNDSMGTTRSASPMFITSTKCKRCVVQPSREPCGSWERDKEKECIHCVYDGISRPSSSCSVLCSIEPCQGQSYGSCLQLHVHLTCNIYPCLSAMETLRAHSPSLSNACMFRSSYSPNLLEKLDSDFVRADVAHCRGSTNHRLKHE
jgi:hypothetical protein